MSVIKILILKTIIFVTLILKKLQLVNVKKIFYEIVD